MDKSKYIGKYVIAGSGFRTIRGHIIDVHETYDEVFGPETWFIVKDEEGSIINQGYAKEEIQEIKKVVKEVYEPLE
jgi:hypothetical protein